MIDTHCHIDLYENPISILNECQKDGQIVIAVTNLPSHFNLGYNHVLPYKRIRLALGLHPLYAEQHKKELPLFEKYFSKTSYIGEVGLDFSREGYATKEIQIQTFKYVLSKVSGHKKLLSIHSRRAEREVLSFLKEYSIENAIFHWYSGPISLIDRIVESGYYFSINPEMIISESGKKIIDKIPLNRILTESDGPFIQVEKREIKPKDVIRVVQYLSEARKININDIQVEINSNFRNLIDNIR